jgi:MFS family permease
VSFVVKHEVVLNRSLLFIALSLFTWGIGEGMFFNFSPIYMAKLGSDPQQIGLILGAFGAVMAITHIPAGRLADRFGRRPLLVIAWAMGLAATVVMALARDLPLFVAGLLGYGLTAFVSSPLSSYMTAARGRWSVAATLSLTTATFSFGMALGPALGGWIGDRYGLRMVYSVAAGIFVVSNVLIQFIEPQPLDHHDPESPPVSLLSNVRFLNFLVVVALAVFAMYLAQPLTPNFLAGVRGLSLGEVGVIFTAGALGNALVSILLGRFPPRIGYPISQALVGLFALLMWLFPVGRIPRRASAGAGTGARTGAHLADGFDLRHDGDGYFLHIYSHPAAGWILVRARSVSCLSDYNRVDIVIHACQHCFCSASTRFTENSKLTTGH